MFTQGELLETIYQQAVSIVSSGEINRLQEELSDEEVTLLSKVVDQSEARKGVITVLITSLLQKVYDPQRMSLPSGQFAWLIQVEVWMKDLLHLL